MKINITSKDFELTPTIKEYINEKMGKLTKFDHKMELAHIVVKRDHHHNKGEVFTVDVIVEIPHGISHKVERSAGDFYAAFDEMHEILKNILEKDHERKTDHKIKA